MLEGTTDFSHSKISLWLTLNEKKKIFLNKSYVLYVLYM